MKKGKVKQTYGATNVMDYQEMGYLKEALVNFLALFGVELSQ